MSGLPGQSPPPAEVKQRHVDEVLHDLREALLGLRFGSVTLTVHEDRVVQIDVTTKTRLKPAY